MRVAIAGHRAMLGQALARQVIAAGGSVLTLGRHSSAAITLDQLDRRRSELSGCAALVVCVASYGKGGLAAAREAYQANLVTPLMLLEAAAAAGVPRLVYVSSTSALAPSDAYGLSKAAAESALAQLAPAAGVALTIVRPSQIYDAAGSAASRQPFLYGVIDQVADGRPVTLAGRSDVSRNYVHVDDVAEAILGTVRLGLDGTFNAVHPQSLTVSEIVALAARLAGRDAAAAFDASRPDLPTVMIPVDSNLFTAEAMTPRAFEAGIQEILDARAAMGAS